MPASWVLAPDGLIGNYRNPNEDGWLLQRGQLALMSDHGVATTVFDRAQIEDGEITALMGQVRLPGPPLFHVLRRVSHPAHPLHATPADADRSVRFLKRPACPPRPNLVVLRAGETSLHESWVKDLDDEDRSWTSASAITAVIQPRFSTRPIMSRTSRISANSRHSTIASHPIVRSGITIGSGCPTTISRSRGRRSTTSSISPAPTALIWPNRHLRSDRTAPSPMA